jgi:hypothetical protein
VSPTFFPAQEMTSTEEPVCTHEYQCYKGSKKHRADQKRLRFPRSTTRAISPEETREKEPWTKIPPHHTVFHCTRAVWLCQPQAADTTLSSPSYLPTDRLSRLPPGSHHGRYFLQERDPNRSSEKLPPEHLSFRPIRTHER